MIDNLALLVAHLLLIATIMRSLRADKAIQDAERGSWRDGPRQPGSQLPPRRSR